MQDGADDAGEVTDDVRRDVGQYSSLHLPLRETVLGCQSGVWSKQGGSSLRIVSNPFSGAPQGTYSALCLMRNTSGGYTDATLRATYGYNTTFGKSTWSPVGDPYWACDVTLVYDF